MLWVQNYNPLQSVAWSTVVAALPIVVLSGLLLAGVSAPRAAISGLLAALAVAVAAFKMPFSAAAAAAACGACFGLMPIGWILLSAVFLYNLTVRSGQFEVIKHSIAAISPDRRLQALLIAFSFGSFLEGGAGFGAPVAISAALLIGLGFPPLYAAGLTLLANTSPVAFGSIGIPLITLSRVSGLDLLALSKVTGSQLLIFSFLISGWLIVVMAGWKGMLECWPAIVVCGGSFAMIQFLVAWFFGPELVDVLAGLGSLMLLTIFLRFWRPKEIWRFPEEREAVPLSGNGTASEAAAAKAGPIAGPIAGPMPTPLQIAYAWTPWVLLSAMIFLWGWPRWKGALDRGFQATARVVCGLETSKIAVPGLTVYRTAPAVPVAAGSDRAAEPMDSSYDCNLLASSGTSVFVAAILAAIWLRIKPRDFFAEFLRTLHAVRWALATIACMLALAYTMKFSGADVTLGLAFVGTGCLYPFFAPFLGWLGVLVTGSDTSANAMFGSLQRVTAEGLGLNPVLIAASNSTGGVMGKMIAAQSIVVAATATGQKGGEGRILRFVLWHSIALAALVGLLTLVQAYVLPGTLPR